MSGVKSLSEHVVSSFVTRITRSKSFSSSLLLVLVDGDVNGREFRLTLEINTIRLETLKKQFFEVLQSYANFWLNINNLKSFLSDMTCTKRKSPPLNGFPKTIGIL